MPHIHINTQEIDNNHLTALIEVFRTAAESMPGKASGRFFGELAGDLNSELNIRQIWGFRTGGQRSVDLPSAKEMDLAELEVITDFLEDAAIGFYNMDRPEVAELFAVAGQLTRNYLSLQEVESRYVSVYNELNSL